MSDSEYARLLTPPANYAVVHLPGRQFPGVVFQGDSLHILCSLAREIRADVATPEGSELEAGLRELSETLDGALHGYEQALEENGIERPWLCPDGDDPEPIRPESAAASAGRAIRTARATRVANRKTKNRFMLGGLAIIVACAALATVFPSMGPVLLVASVAVGVFFLMLTVIYGPSDFLEPRRDRNPPE